MLKTIFFHSLVWDNDVWIVYIVWAILFPGLFWLVRFVHKKLRKKKLLYKGNWYSPCRDLFLQMNGFEYLIVALVLYSIYLGFWAWLLNPVNADWIDWRTYCVILPQVVVLGTIIGMFFYRYNNFRNPYKR